MHASQAAGCMESSDGTSSTEAFAASGRMRNNVEAMLGTPSRLPRPLADGMIVGAAKETARWLAVDDRTWHQVRDAERSCCSAQTIQELSLALVIYLHLYRTVYLSQFDVKIAWRVCKKRLPKAETWPRHVLLSGVCNLRVNGGEMCFAPRHPSSLPPPLFLALAEGQTSPAAS